MSACFMNWPKVCSEYQRYESFQSCFRYRKTITWSGLPGIPKNWWSKRKHKEKEETNNKKKTTKEILNFKIL